MECTADLRRGHPTTGKAGRDNAQAYAGSIRRDRCLAPGGDMSQPIRGRDSETSGNDDGKGNVRCMKRKFSSRNLRPASMTCLGCLRPFHEKGKQGREAAMQRIRLRQAVNMPICQLVKTRNTPTNPRATPPETGLWRPRVSQHHGTAGRATTAIAAHHHSCGARDDSSSGSPNGKPDGRKHHGMIRRAGSVRTADAYTYVQYQQNIR